MPMCSGETTNTHFLVSFRIIRIYIQQFVTASDVGLPGNLSRRYWAYIPENSRLVSQHKIVIESQTEEPTEVLPSVRKIYVELPAPTMEDNSAGLLPTEIDREKINYVGNASLAGAKWALLSSNARRYADELARKTKHLKLSLDTNFQMEFADAMIFPS